VRGAALFKLAPQWQNLPIKRCSLTCICMLLCNTSTTSNQFHYMQVKTRYTADHFPTTADQLGFITRTHIIQHVQDLVFPAHSTVPQTLQSADTTWMQTVTWDPYITISNLKRSSSSVDFGRRMPGRPVHPHLWSLLACQLALKRLDLLA